MRNSENPYYGHRLGRTVFRLAGGSFAGWWGWVDNQEVLPKVAGICNAATKLGEGLSQNASGFDAYSKLAYRCLTQEGVANPMVAGLGGAIAGLVVVVGSIVDQPQHGDYSRKWAAWHFVQGVCAVATPALVDILVKRFSLDSSLQTQLLRPEVMAFTGLQMAMLAIGAPHLATQFKNLLVFGNEMLQARLREQRAERRERRIEELKARLSQEEVSPRPSGLRGLGRAFQAVRFEPVDSDLTPGVIEHIGDLVLAGTQGHFRPLERFLAYQRFVRMTQRQKRPGL